MNDSNIRELTGSGGQSLYNCCNFCIANKNTKWNYGARCWHRTCSIKSA